MRLLVFVALTAILQSFTTSVGANEVGNKTIYGPNIDLTFTWGYDHSPDCVKRQPLVEVNGIWPPPTIRVKAKEKITLRVHNELVAVAFTIHLHGFTQLGTPWADGTSMISTCPIPPDTASSTQEFFAPEEPGTYIYHGHVAHAKVAGFAGMLLVDENPDEGIFYDRDVYTHDEELELFLADSYHHPSLPALAGLLQKEFRWVGDPQTILMNGQAYFNCKANHLYACENFNDTLCNVGVSSNQVCGAGQPVYYNNLVHCNSTYCRDRTTLQVESNKTYLLRVANGGVSSMLNLAIQGHTLTVVELDGNPVKPRTVVTLDLHVGQRAAVLLTTNQPEGVYWVSAKVRGREAERTGGTLLVYNDLYNMTLEGKDGETDAALKDLQKSQPHWDDWEFMAEQQKSFESTNDTAMPKLDDVERTFVFLQTQERFDLPTINHSPAQGDDSGIGIGNNLDETPQCRCKDEDGFLRWAADRKTFVNPKTPLLHSMFYGTNKKTEEELESEGSYKLVKDKVYDIVLQNYPNCKGKCEVHPWHLHGHFFWHVGTFEGTYDPKVGYPVDGEGGSNYVRDTILVVGADDQNRTCSDTIKPCGYTVIRFLANNPGAWFFHCHIDWHLVMGMAVAFYYDDLPNTAPEPNLSMYDICGEVNPQVVVDRVLRNLQNSTEQQNGTTQQTGTGQQTTGTGQSPETSQSSNGSGENKLQTASFLSSILVLALLVSDAAGW